MTKIFRIGTAKPSANPEYAKQILLLAQERINEALKLFQAKSTVEIERRFLVNIEEMPSLKNMEYVDIVQAYIPSNGMVVRIRTADYKAYLTLKGPKVGAKADEFEYEIRNKIENRKISTQEIQQRGFTTKKDHKGLGLTNIKEIDSKYPDMSISYTIQEIK